MTERGGDVDGTAINPDDRGGASGRVDQAGESGDVRESGAGWTVEDKREVEFFAQLYLYVRDREEEIVRVAAPPSPFPAWTSIAHELWSFAPSAARPSSPRARSPAMS